MYKGYNILYNIQVPYTVHADVEFALRVHTVRTAYRFNVRTPRLQQVYTPTCAPHFQTVINLHFNPPPVPGTYSLIRTRVVRSRVEITERLFTNGTDGRVGRQVGRQVDFRHNTAILNTRSDDEFITRSRQWINYTVL